MNLGVFGEWWNTSIGMWWASQQWGTVAQWISGLLTAGSLFLAVSILRRDQRRNERSLANGFVTWYRFDDEPLASVTKTGMWGLIADAYNASDVPVIRADLASHPDDPYFRQQLITTDTLHTRVIPSKVTASARQEFKSIPIEVRIYVVFTDAQSKQWTRDLRTNKLLSKRLSQRFVEAQYAHAIATVNSFGDR